MSDGKFWVSTILICFAIFLVILISGILDQREHEELMKKAEKKIQIEAVSNNFAHWEVNLNGETTFKWNTKE